MGEHTPGPWRARFIYRMIKAARNDPGLLMEAKSESDWADATLIAAAPDLLAACKHAFRFLKERGDPFTGPDWEIGYRLSAAIAKAEGQAVDA